MQRTTSIRQIYACGSRLGFQSQLLHRRISQPKTCSPAKQHSSGSHLAKIWRNLHHRELMTHACGWVATPTCNKQRLTIIYCCERVVLSLPLQQPRLRQVLGHQLTCCRPLHFHQQSECPLRQMLWTYNCEHELRLFAAKEGLLKFKPVLLLGESVIYDLKSVSRASIYFVILSFTRSLHITLEEIP